MNHLEKRKKAKPTGGKRVVFWVRSEFSNYLSSPSNLKVRGKSSQKGGKRKMGISTD